MDSVAIFKALGNHSRLEMVRSLLEKNRTAEELCEYLKLVPSTVSHHAKQLIDIGLIQSQKDKKTVIYSARTKAFDISLLNLIQAPLGSEKSDGRSDRWTRDVLKNFIDCGRLLSIPRQRKKRRAILEHMIESFEVERQYPEKELNVILNSWHEDHCFLRREMIAEGLLSRKEGVYWRV